MAMTNEEAYNLFVDTTLANSNAGISDKNTGSNGFEPADNSTVSNTSSNGSQSSNASTGGGGKHV